MPKCTAGKIDFGRLGCRVIEGDFIKGGVLTSDGGLVLLRQVDAAPNVGRRCISLVRSSRRVSDCNPPLSRRREGRCDGLLTLHS
jgi:hypothetical protein